MAGYSLNRFPTAKLSRSRFEKIPCGTAGLPSSEFGIGVGRVDWLRLPLPPNRTGGFPASGSPVNGITSERVDEPCERRLPDCRTSARRSRHWSIVDDQSPDHDLVVPCVGGGCSVNA